LQRLQRLRFGGINRAVGAGNFLDIFKKRFAEFRICASELLEGVFKKCVQFVLVKIVVVADSPVKLLLQVRSLRKQTEHFLLDQGNFSGVVVVVGLRHVHVQEEQEVRE